MIPAASNIDSPVQSAEQRIERSLNFGVIFTNNDVNFISKSTICYKTDKTFIVNLR